MTEKKRVFWLFNHTTLRAFEVPLLINMGFEVYTPKIYQYQSGDPSASVDFQYDNSLSIPREDLEYLNTIDFYQRFIPDKVMKLMNRYFDVVIFGAYIEVVQLLVRRFRGIMILHAFGFTSNATYTSLFASKGISLINEIRDCGERFWFGGSYKNLPEVENEFLKNRFVYLPISMKKDRVNRIWSGGDERILFISPRILSNSYYRGVYDDFIRDFGDIPHVIGGGQMIPVENDPTVAGFLPREQYDNNMRHLACMYYHSREPRHLHYHPLEAVANGMPLVFMSGGMLDSLGGSDLPGRCTSISEARKKLLALSRGDMRLAEEIIGSQSVLLKEFSHEYCAEKWKIAFQRILNHAQQPEATVSLQKKRIAVILPAEYLGGVLDYTIRLIRAIVKGAEERGEPVSVVFGYSDSPDYGKKIDLQVLKKLNVSLRPYHWRERDAAWVDQATQLLDMQNVEAKNVCVLEDGMSCFEDCDYLVFTADRIPGHLFTGRPYALVVHDYIQRYVPEVYGSYFEWECLEAARNADAVFVTTPSTGEDAVQYAGVEKCRVILTPLMFELAQETETPPLRRDANRRKYFLWPTNASPHKNHENALKALIDYYDQGGSLECYITGVNTDWFTIPQKDEGTSDEITAYALNIRKTIQKNNLLRKHIHIMGNLPKMQYFRLLQGACFVFHPGYGDNGNGSVIDAASVGVPTICSSYPAMEYIDRKTGLNAHFFDPLDPESITDALADGEREHERYRSEVPTKEQLGRFTWDSTYAEIYDILRDLIG